MNRNAIPAGLRTLAELQAYALSHDQATGYGLSKNVLAGLVAAGHWQRLTRGIFLASPATPSWDALAWSGILLGGDQARLGPEASGYLHGLLESEPKSVDVLVPYGRSVRAPGPWRFVRERPTARSPRRAGSPPRLTFDETLIDLAAKGTEAEVVALVTKAVQLRRTRPDRVLRVLEARSVHPHRKLLTALLADVAQGAESPLELAYLREVERAHGLPKGRRQRSHRGLPYLSDVSYEEFALLVELDGRPGHEGMGRFRDMWRDNEFALLQLLSLRYGWFDVVDHPCAVAGQVAALLHQRGWTGVPRRCRRCAQLGYVA